MLCRSLGTGVEEIVLLALRPVAPAGERERAATISVIVVVLPLTKPFYAGFYRCKAVDSYRRRRPATRASRTGPRPRNFRTQQPAASRRSFRVRFRRWRNSAGVR